MIGAVRKVRAGCYPWAALSVIDSKTLYTKTFEFEVQNESAVERCFSLLLTSSKSNFKDAKSRTVPSGTFGTFIFTAMGKWSKSKEARAKLTYSKKLFAL